MLNASYTFQIDDSSGQGVNQIGRFVGNEESLDNEAQFNYLKHKGMLLFLHVFNDRFSLSLYDELICIAYYERQGLLAEAPERADWLFLSSIWFKARLVDRLFARARYIYRVDSSTVSSESFQDYIYYLGLEYEF